MVNKFLHCATSLALASLLWALLGGRLRAQPQELFQAQVDLGRACFREQRYDEALKAFQAAYAMRPQPRLLINLGTVHRRLAQPKEALASYEAYLRAEPNPTPEERAQLEQAMAESRSMLAAQQAAAKKEVPAPKPAGIARREPRIEFERVPIQPADFLPAGLHPLSIAGSKDDELWFAGRTLFHFDGKSWSDQGSTWRDPAGTLELNFRKIWGTTKDNAWLIAASDAEATLLHFGGEQWFKIPFEKTKMPIGFWGRSSSDLWLMDHEGGISHFDGLEWLPAAAPAGVSHTKMNALLGRSAEEVWAVGERGAIARWDGKQLKKYFSGTDSDLVAIWASGASDLWAGGDSAALVHFDGKSWSLTALAIPKEQFERPIIEGFWGSGPSDLWAVGGDGRRANTQGGFILHYDGKSWTRSVPALQQHLHSIWGSSASSIWAAGAGGSILHFDGSSWSEAETAELPSGVRWNSIWGTGPSNVWVVGSGGMIAHFDGEKWSMRHSRPKDLMHLWRGAPDDIWAVGQYLHHYDGKLWSTSLSGTKELLTGVWGSTESGEVWAVGENGTILRHEKGPEKNNEPSRWTRVRSGTTKHLKWIWGSGPQDLWAVGDAGVLHYDGHSWAPVNPGVASDTKFLQIEGTGPRDVWLLDISGNLFRFDGVRWQKGPMPKNFWISTFLEKSPQDIYVAGEPRANRTYQETILHWNGRSWQPLRTANIGFISRLHGTASGDIWAVGDESALLRYRPHK